VEYPEPGLQSVHPELSGRRREDTGQERVICVLDISPSGDLGEVCVRVLSVDLKHESLGWHAPVYRDLY
jgi:hypothetical protein